MLRLCFLQHSITPLVSQSFLKHQSQNYKKRNVLSKKKVKLKAKLAKREWSLLWLNSSGVCESAVSTMEKQAEVLWDRRKWETLYCSEALVKHISWLAAKVDSVLLKRAKTASELVGGASDPCELWLQQFHWSELATRISVLGGLWL